MQNTKEVYFLTIQEAEMFAQQHETEEDWDLWTDAEVLNYIHESIQEESAS
jgi:predicted TPR repeat methyltransferase